MVGRDIVYSKNTKSQALFWSAHGRISADFSRILDPSESWTNLVRNWTDM